MADGKKRDVLADSLEKVAEHFAESLLDGGAPKKGEVDTFKVLAHYFTTTRKLNGVGDDDDDGFNFNDAKKAKRAVGLEGDEE